MSGGLGTRERAPLLEENVSLTEANTMSPNDGLKTLTGN